MSADRWTECPKCGGDLREDYDIGVEGDTFQVSFRASCGHWRKPGCGFSFAFEASEGLK